MTEIYKLIIIGSGNAGYTAAIYASRAQLAPVLFSGGEIGGQLALTTDVENFPGFPEGIQGPELMARMRTQAERFGTKIIDKIVDKVDFNTQPFSVWLGKDIYQSQAVIIATGASAIWLGIESEQRLRGKGVSSCATCDGFFFKGKDIVLVGGGDVAMEDGIFLTKFANSIKILVRREELRASKFMQDRAKNNPKIEFIWNTEVVEVLGENSVTGVKIKNNKTNEESEIICQGLFVAIGHRPNTEIFKNQIELDTKGYIILKDRSMTNISGVFAAGDVHDHEYRQAVTAAGDGCAAAMDAERWLEKKET
ncbi:thioredoxin-disulfide reductase [bacterium CG10_46_32]|nr:MAG: thioredoxin-disulfide reductase [bacterium CG10_46_32]PIR56112.1 MAG: thioredoxin-disulfide reductase [Parcubacteria group bacterium CG10_big_fil_rev_8_21_14_0_10_46_32]